MVEIKSMWQCVCNRMFKTEREALACCPPFQVWFCPKCGGTQNTRAAAIECCGYDEHDDNPAGSFKDDDK